MPEAEIRLSKLHRREKALYALFLLESRSGGINFSKPDNAHALRKFDYRMQLIQLKYEMIYEGFGGNRANAPKICQSENRLPMLSLISSRFALSERCCAMRMIIWFSVISLETIRLQFRRSCVYATILNR